MTKLISIEENIFIEKCAQTRNYNKMEDHLEEIKASSDKKHDFHEKFMSHRHLLNIPISKTD